MTRPTIIFLGPDGGDTASKKVFIRTLLYCTSERGQYIQNMFVRLQRGESVQNFNVWVYDDKGLVRGSGLFVGKAGIASNHHFLMPRDGTKYHFIAGKYVMEVFVETPEKRPLKLFTQSIGITKEQELELQKNNAGLYFDWAPNSQNYDSHIDIRSIPKIETETIIKPI